jgi:hypothetical protein
MLFSIWLGGPLGDEGSMRDFRANVAEAAKRLRDWGPAIVWTDVPRDKFDAVRSLEASQVPIELRDVHNMLEWAKRNKVHLVNVDEVFTQEANHPLVRDLMRVAQSEMAKQNKRGYAAASDIYRLLILFRFGGVYSDGDNKVSTLKGEVAAVEASQEGYAVHRKIKDGKLSVGNSALVGPAAHPFFQLYMQQIQENYQLAQKDLYLRQFGPSFIETQAKHDWFVKPEGQPRRHEVMLRTGPDVLGQIQGQLGIENKGFPGIACVEMGHMGSWAHDGDPIRKSSAPSETKPTPTPKQVQRSLEKVISTLITELAKRSGDLHLTEVAEAIGSLPDPAVTWTAVLKFIAADERLAAKVRTVTDSSYDNKGELHRVKLPREAQALLSVDTDAQPELWLGELTRKACMAAAVAA